MADWTNKKVTILGLGRSGIATAHYLADHGATVLVSESQELNDERKKQAEELKKRGIKVEAGGHSDKGLSSADLIVTSPGIPPTADVIKKAVELGKEVICDVELAFRDSTVPFIAVTGTNGKSTTVALISFLLESTGLKAPACGNIGVPILTRLKDRPDFLVVEVSSFQIHYCSTFAPKVAVWLNLTPDHLEWHGGLDAYIAAKEKLFSQQTVQDTAILNMDDPVVANQITKAQVFPFSVQSDLDYCIQGAFMKEEFLCYRIGGQSRVVCGKNELQIIGNHNLENCLAAISVGAVLGISAENIARYLKEFKALEHRLEYVATIDGVPYYNDSKATNTDSTIKALESFPNQRVVLIAGGRDKGTSLSDFVQAVRKYASAVILIGEAKDRFERALREGGVQNIYPIATGDAKAMEEAIDLGGQLKKGPVLLSPACASFDMFKDFEHRGHVFKDIVRRKEERSAKVAPPA